MPAVTNNPGLQSLMGIVPQTAAVQQQAPTGLMNYQPGYWSQQAYKMAGSPIQGPYAAVPVPAATGVSGSSSGGGGSSVGGTALGILGALAKNPSLLKSGYNAISGLLGGGGGAASGSAASILAGGSPTLSAVGTGAVAPAVDSAAADAAGALGGSDAAAGGAAGGLLGGAGASAGSGVAGAGSIAAGQGAASTTAGAAGSSLLGAAGPLAVAGLVGLMGSGALDDKAQAQATAAYQAWLKATGATSKVINPPTASQASAVAQGGFAGIGSGYQPHSVVFGPDGKPMSDAAAQAAAYEWAQANGMSPGNLMAPAQAQKIISSGGYGSQVYGTAGYPTPPTKSWGV